MEQQRHIVIVGIGAAGLYASKAALSQDRNCRVTFIEERDFDQFSPCALPFALEGLMDVEELKHSLPEVKNRLSKLLFHRAVSMDPDAKTLTVRNLATGEDREIAYHSLVLAAGAAPMILPVPGAREFLGKGIHVVSDIESVSSLRKAALSAPDKSAAVIGAGAIGLEAAHALVKLGIDVAVVEAESRPLPRTIDPEMAGAVLERMQALGMKTLFGNAVTRILGRDRVEGIRVGEEIISCGIVVMAAGRAPRSKLAADAGAAVNRGFLITDSRMKTTLKDVYAAGDTVQTFSRIDRTPAVMQLATAAYRQGTVAGINAAGGNTPYAGALNTFVTSVGPLQVGGTGYTLETAGRLGYRARAVTLTAETKPHYMPDCTTVTLRAVVEEDTGRLLGVQAHGLEGVAWRINVCATAIHGSMTMYDLADAELAYYPPVSQMVDPLSQLADIAIKRLKLPPRTCREVFSALPAPDNEG